MKDLSNFQNIPNPVGEPSVRMELLANLRYCKIVNYVKTGERYLMDLVFSSNIDFAIFVKFIQGSSIRLTEYRSDTDARVRILVTDSRIGDDDWDQAWKWVNQELPLIGAAIAIYFPDFVLPTCRCVVDLHNPGGGKAAMAPPVPTKMVGKAGITNALALLKEFTGDDFNLFLAKCDADQDFKEAASYTGCALTLGSANSWANLYRAYEVVADRFGGEDSITKTHLFCSVNQLNTFKRTVNHQEAIGAFLGMPDSRPPRHPIQ